MNIVSDFRSFWDGKVTKDILAKVDRATLIKLLEWNDHNGIYADHHCINEFGRAATRAELEACFWRQYYADEITELQQVGFSVTHKLN